jgi:hypothetical protein
MKEKKDITFLKYYNQLADRNPQTELRDKICKEIGIAVSTFYLKLRKNSFNYLEKKEIAKITGEKIDVLFPEI